MVYKSAGSGILEDLVHDRRLGRVSFGPEHRAPVLEAVSGWRTNNPRKDGYMRSASDPHAQGSLTHEWRSAA
jgi:hypothetical protein